MNGFNKLKKFVEENGTTIVPNGYVLDGFKLGKWAIHVRYQYRNHNNPNFKKTKLNEAQIKLLDDIGFVVDKDDAVWEEMYLQAKRYYEEHGNLMVPSGNSLFAWLIRQRSLRNGKIAGVITEERIAKLDAIGFEWATKKELFDAEWARCYTLAKAYYDAHGVFPSSIPEDADYEKLYKNTRIHNYRLSEEKIALLDAIGIKWAENSGRTEDTTAAWEKRYAELYDYWKKSGTTKVPVGYITKAGIKLYSWCATQRAKHLRTEENRAAIKAGTAELKLEKMLSDYQIRKLNDIDFDWGDKYRMLYECEK